MSDADPWDSNQPPLIPDAQLPALPDRLERLRTVRRRTPLFELGEDAQHWNGIAGAPNPDDLPEVQTLRHQGWEVAPSEPYLAFLPAVWPSEHRGWIRNRLPWVWFCPGDPPSIVPPSEDDLQMEQEIEEDYPANLEGTGIPVPPLGRIWLLRSPYPKVTVAQLASLITIEAERRAKSTGADIFRQKAYLIETARDVLRWSQDAINKWYRHQSPE